MNTQRIQGLAFSIGAVVMAVVAVTSALDESPFLKWMDRVFLRAMTRHPQKVPEFLTRLFDHVPTRFLVRFLESKPRMADLWHVMHTLPAAPFLAAAVR